MRLISKLPCSNTPTLPHSVLVVAYVCSLCLALAGYAQETADHDHERDAEMHGEAMHEDPAHAESGDHAGHEHGGPPPKGLVLSSIILTAGGAVLVSLTLLAIFWKTIDAAFHKSRFRESWQRRSTRVLFAIGVMIVAGAVVGGITWFQVVSHEHETEVAGATELRPLYGGVVKRIDRFAVELVARRTGEVRMYLGTLEGKAPSSYDVNAEVVVPQTTTHGDETSVSHDLLPMKLNYDGTYFLAVALPFQSRDITAHLILRVFDQTYEADYELQVQD